MNKNRLEAFSDGVLAIIITIMVLEFKIPESPSWASLGPLAPVLISYIISFLLLGIYWGNHHNLLHGLKKVNSSILLSNLLLLFCLSFVPFATGWMGANHFESNTIILYAIVIILCGLSYGLLQKSILKTLDPHSEIVKAIKGQDKKVIISAISAALAIPFAFLHPAISGALFILQSIIWIIPDKNIEKAINNSKVE